MNDDFIQLIENTAKDGYYSQHLADLNTEGNKVSTSDDIKNADGVLLIKKGTIIDESTRSRLLKHKLLKPLHFQVGLDSQINATVLIQDFKKTYLQNEEIIKINKASQYTEFFNDLITTANIPSVIWQKLTVMKSQIPNEYKKGLFTAWLSGLIAKELKLDNKTTRNVLITAIIHDVGLLHLSPDLVMTMRKLNAKEWRTLQAHVLVGQLIIDAIDDVDKDVARGVLEHHENCYGSGYPRALSGHERGLIGRIIGMSDSVHALYNKFKNSGRSLGDILPYLQLNSITHSKDVYRAVLTVVKRAELKSTVMLPKPSVKKYAEFLSSESEVMRKNKVALEIMSNDLSDFWERNKKDRNLSTLRAILIRMLQNLKESGLLSDELGKYLQETAHSNDEDSLEILNEIDLLTDELRWQMQNTMRMLEVYFDKVIDKNPSLANSIKYATTVIQLSLSELYKLDNEDE